MVCEVWRGGGRAAPSQLIRGSLDGVTGYSFSCGLYGGDCTTTNTPGDLETQRPFVEALQRATDELQAIRNAFGPIYTYYFPRSWLTIAARRLRIASMPDFARHRARLQVLRDDAWRVIDEAKTAFEAIAATHAPSVFKQFAELSYRQIYFDGHVVVLMNEFVIGMDNGDPKCADYFFAMQQFQSDASANLERLRHHTRMQQTRLQQRGQ